jgi:MFS family permease
MKNMSTSQVNNNQINQDSGPHPHRWKALGILSLAQFLIILDTSIIGVALPTIQLTAAISTTHKEQTGLASGLVNTSYQIGSALGLAIIVAIASNQTETLENIGLPSIEAINGGFHSAFIVGAIISVIATALVVIGLKMRMKMSTEKTIAKN